MNMFNPIFGTTDWCWWGTGCCPNEESLVPYCTTNINANELDSLLHIVSALRYSIQCMPIPCPAILCFDFQAILIDSECQVEQPVILFPYFPYHPAPHEYCLDCIDNDNDGLLDYDDLECPEDLIESCMMDTTSICTFSQQHCENSYNENTQSCEDYYNEFASYCQSYLEGCSSNCEDDSTCIEQCQDYFQSCTDGVEDIYQDCISSLEEIYQDCTTDFEMFYQECIIQIEEICINNHCTCDSTANN